VRETFPSASMTKVPSGATSTIPTWDHRLRVAHWIAAD
jgi:hypothetical protein